MSLKKLSGVADGASAVAHEFDTVDPLVNAAAKLLQIKNDGSLMFEVDHEGTLFGPASDWWRFKSNVADSPNQVAYEFDTVTALTEATIKLINVENGGASKFTLDIVGSGWFGGGLQVNQNDEWNNGGINVGAGANSAQSVNLKVAAAGSTSIKCIEGAATTRNVFSMFTTGVSYLSPQQNVAGGNKIMTFYNNTGAIIVWALDANGDIRLLSGVQDSQVADGASAVAHRLNSENAFTTSGANLLQVDNNDVEKFAVDKDGNILVQGTQILTTQQGAVTDAAVITTVGANTGTAGAGLSLIGDTSGSDQSGPIMNDLVALQEDVLDLRTQLNAALAALRAHGIIAT